jgi:hypothetical protein
MREAFVALFVGWTVLSIFGMGLGYVLAYTYSTDPTQGVTGFGVLLVSACLVLQLSTALAGSRWVLHSFYQPVHHRVA